jgi:hypothetical protein
VEEAASDLEARLSGRVTRLEDVVGLADQVRAQHHAEEDQLIDAIEPNANYEDVVAALNDAFTSGAISKGFRQQGNGFRVRVGRPLDGLRLTFKFTPSMVAGIRILQIVAWPPPNANTSFSVNWLPDEQAGVVFERLRATLAEARIAVSEEEFDITFALQNLVQSLRISIEARRGQRTRPSGRVVEIVDDRWAFTEAGLESLTDNFSVSDLQFPKRRPAQPSFIKLAGLHAAAVGAVLQARWSGDLAVPLAVVAARLRLLLAVVSGRVPASPAYRPADGGDDTYNNQDRQDDDDPGENSFTHVCPP